MPTKHDYEALARALTFDHHYDPTRIPDLEEDFWTSTLSETAGKAFHFSACSGATNPSEIDYSDEGLKIFDLNLNRVRCVSEANRHNPPAAVGEGH